MWLYVTITVELYFLLQLRRTGLQATDSKAVLVSTTTPQANVFVPIFPRIQIADSNAKSRSRNDRTVLLMTDEQHADKSVVFVSVIVVDCA